MLDAHVAGTANHIRQLRAQISFCVNCGVSNQRPNSTVEFQHTEESKKDTIAFSDDGVCDACRTAERKKEIDWEERERKLVELCDRFRSRNGSYDCLVPGSGGKDSFYQSWVLKYKYGMNPLTVTWAPNMYTDWGQHNFNAWIHSGMDNYLMTASGRSKRLLTRLAVENIFHAFQPFIIGQKCFAPKMALLFNIPLVFYGENEAEYGNPFEDNADAQRSYDYFASASDEDLFLGIRSVADVSTLLACGADKVALNTAATRDPALITEIADRFGAQATVVSIEAIRGEGGLWQAMTDNGRNHTGRDVLEWAREAEDRGAGEIVLTTIHTEGLGQGYDLEMIEKVADMVSIPVVACGGLGTSDHLSDLIQQTKASAAASAQALHWKKLELSDLRSTLADEGCFVRPI